MFECFSEMQNVVNQTNTRSDLDQEGEYYRLEFGCQRFKHIADLPDAEQYSVKAEPSFLRWMWWKH